MLLIINLRGEKVLSKNKEFFLKLNDAFATGEVDFLIENLCEDIQWEYVGEKKIQGKETVVSKMLEPMRGVIAEQYVTKQIITHGNKAVIEGTMKMPDENGEERRYSFCDIYTLDKFKNGKIKTLTTYLIQING